MTDQRGLAFMDAVKELASEAGMEVPAPDPARGATGGAARHTARRHGGGAGMVRGAICSRPKASRRATISQRRGLRRAHDPTASASARRPTTAGAEDRRSSSFDERLLIEAGLLIEVEEQEPYDRFRGRLMLPIQDARGRVIAFGGRILRGSRWRCAEIPEFSPDTPLFDKGRTLYNLHRAAPASRKTDRDDRGRRLHGRDRAGRRRDRGSGRADGHRADRTADRTALAAWSTSRCCASMATLRAQRAAMRAVDARPAPAAPRPFAARSCTLPAGLDPTTCCKRDGAQGAWSELLDEPQACSTRCGSMNATPLRSTSPEDKAGLEGAPDGACRGDPASGYPRALPPRTARSLFRLRLSAARIPASGGSRGNGPVRPRRARTALRRR